MVDKMGSYVPNTAQNELLIFSPPDHLLPPSGSPPQRRKINIIHNLEIWIRGRINAILRENLPRLVGSSQGGESVRPLPGAVFGALFLKIQK